MTQPRASDPSRWFLDQLLAAVRHGQRLDDPRNAEVLSRWVKIVAGLPDVALSPAIPEALRGLLRQPNLRGDLIRCGIAPSLLLQHESIAPYILSWRRYEAARLNEGHSNGSPVMKQALQVLQREIRQHLETYRSVFDHIAGLDQTHDRGVTDDASLQQKRLAEFVNLDTATLEPASVGDRPSGHDVVSKAFRLYRLHLFSLKEERGESPDRRPYPRLIAAEIAVQSQIATLEALGQGERAESEAFSLLGPTLAALYLADIQWRSAASAPADQPTVVTAPDPEASLPANVRVFRPRVTP